MTDGSKEHQLQIDWSGRQNLLRLWLVDDTHVKHLLRVLFDHTPVGETDCFLLIDTIAREMSTSRRTVQRAVKQAIDDELLIVFGSKGRRRCNTYRLRMANIFDRAKHETGGDKLAPQACQPDTPWVPTWHARRAKLAHRSSPEVPNEPPPPKRSACATPSAHPSDEWSVVVEELIAYGIQDPKPAADEARKRGCSAPFVRRVIEFARTKVSQDGIPAWGPGALRSRVKNNLCPGQEIDDESLWVPPDAEYVKAMRRAAEEAARRNEADQQQAEREARAESDRALSELESQCGELLDGLTATEAEQLAADVFGGRGTVQFKVFKRHGRQAKAVRPDLLKALASAAVEEVNR